MPNFGFIIDNRRCIGCHACTVACKSEHNVPVGVNRTWVKYIEKGQFPNSRRLFSVMRCNHCDNAPCVEICPVTALFRRPDGIVDFDNRRCIGCKACTQACPYDALYIDPATHTAAKCNYCAHRIDAGLEPACVNVCPTQAIISGDLDDPDSRISKLKAREQVTARRTEKGTLPSLFYIEGDADSLEPTATDLGMQSLWSQQQQGVGHWADHQPHALDRLGSLLDLGDRPETISAPNSARSQELFEAVKPQSKRAYDAPQKGVLWGWQVSGYLWTKSIAAGICLLPMAAKTMGIVDVGYATELIAPLLALVFLGLTGILLIWDLDQPKRFLYVLLRPQWKSWLVKGAYVITAYSALLMFYLIAKIINQHDGIAEALLRIPLMVAAVMAAVYTAFLFAQAKGRDFWQSPILPIHMLLHCVIAGAAMFTFLIPFVGGRHWTAFVGNVLVGGLLIRLVCDLVELFMVHPTTSASQAAASIRSGRYSSLFWGGSVIAGTLIPVLLAVTLPVSILPLAGLFAMVGVFLSEHIWVRAPQQIPLS